MPASSVWIRGDAKNGTSTRASTRTDNNATNQQPATHAQGHRHSRPKASTWRSGQPKELHATAKPFRPASKVDTANGNASTASLEKRAPTSTLQKTAGELANEQILEAAQKAHAELRAKRLQAELQRQEMELRRRKEVQEKVATARDAAASLAASMETSDRLKRKRADYEKELVAKSAEERKEKDRATKVADVQVDQRRIIAHILRQHSSYYRMLMVQEHASLGEVGAAWRKLSLRLHPDRCSLPNAREAFEKVRAAVEALRSQARKTSFVGGV